MKNQTDKLKLLALTFNKVSSDKLFIAYYLQQFLLVENKTQEELVNYLESDAGNFYKLGLSKLPDSFASNYHERILNICSYTGISIDKLKYVLLQVNGYTSIEQAIKLKTLEEQVFERWHNSGNRFIRSAVRLTVPAENYLLAATAKIPTQVYRSAFAFAAVIILLAVSNLRVDEMSYYRSLKQDYRESTKHLALMDKTFVYKNYYKKV